MDLLLLLMDSVYSHPFLAILAIIDCLIIYFSIICLIYNLYDAKMKFTLIPILYCISFLVSVVTIILVFLIFSFFVSETII